MRTVTSQRPCQVQLVRMRHWQRRLPPPPPRRMRQATESGNPIHDASWSRHHRSGSRQWITSTTGNSNHWLYGHRYGWTKLYGEDLRCKQWVAGTATTDADGNFTATLPAFSGCECGHIQRPPLTDDGCGRQRVRGTPFTTPADPDTTDYGRRQWSRQRLAIQPLVIRSHGTAGTKLYGEDLRCKQWGCRVQPPPMRTVTSQRPCQVPDWCECAIDSDGDGCGRQRESGNPIPRRPADPDTTAQAGQPVITQRLAIQPLVIRSQVRLNQTLRWRSTMQAMRL